MTIMDMIRNWKDSKSKTGEKYKEMEENARLEKMLSERAKSSNQRELENYYKRLQEDDIKKQLDKIHKKQNHESWKGKNMFSGKCTILKQDKSILTNDKSMFNQSNSFMSKAGGFM